MKELKKDNEIQKGHTLDGASDASFIFIGQKIEKLGNVLYLLTKIIPDQDPLKWNIRDKSLQMMSFISQLQDASSYARAYACERITADVYAMLRFIGFSRNAGYLTDTHAQIIEAEYQHVLESCRNASGTWITEAVVLPEAAGGVPLLKGAYDRTEASGKMPNRALGAPQNKVSGAPHVRVQTAASGGRREQILRLMQTGREYSIKEVFQGVPGVSEKTIQRELLAMVELGILAKKGERRWSTYSRI